MLFKITKASKPGFREDAKPCKKAAIIAYETGEKEWVVEINNLGELISLQEEVGEELILGFNDRITIYDDFIE